MGVRLYFELPPPLLHPHSPLWGRHPVLRSSEFLLGQRGFLQAVGLASSQPPSPLCSQLQELLEYMRKLEARLEKVADEKWNEDAVTEDEEAAAGPSLYTPPSWDTSSPPNPTVCPVGESCM